MSGIRPWPEQLDTLSISHDFGGEPENITHILDALTWSILERLPWWDELRAWEAELLEQVRAHNQPLALEVDSFVGEITTEIVQFAVRFLPVLVQEWPAGPLGFDAWFERAIHAAGLSEHFPKTIRVVVSCATHQDRPLAPGGGCPACAAEPSRTITVQVTGTSDTEQDRVPKKVIIPYTTEA